MAFGCTDPDHLPMTAKQFNEWQAYDLVEPIGNDWLYLQLAHLCVMFHNAHKPQDATAAKMDDFLPPHLRDIKSDPQESQSIEDQKEKAMWILSAFMGR